MEKTAMALSGLFLPNLGGPNGKVRRLYNYVVSSVTLYGTPVWAPEVRSNRRVQSVLRAAQRRMSGRVIRAYRTTAHSVNVALAEMPPLKLAAQVHLEVYERVAELKEEGNDPVSVQTIESIKSVARRRLMKKWEEWLPRTNRGGSGILDTMRPHLEKWMDTRAGLTFHATQVLTGHGCFGWYLRRIGKDSERCWHCAALCDTAGHTLRDCLAWAEERGRLISIIRIDDVGRWWHSYVKVIEDELRSVARLA
ncbi:PREDICTED: uncharacterized protein LOC108769862 [Trachymyrmex cornetzi]|uniref:uncharacterized protein LOC108769862 n=1 Tax=Trachymyrmex cornetzi TaxID=471704 RepID=UPI00084ED4DB|nr:PREDICTED: uncharacterized protein LOC108769862 [Trachymyrmex cornetzi]